MKVPRSSSLLDRRLQAEVRRILRLLERTRRTRRRIRLWVALETGVARRRMGTKSGGARYGR